ncbi:formate/nitrite transporter family protein [Desulfitobacterium sp. AusDCA]|uniref:formate/nitrite transporter family protein n=1 Tax=Desulfitobacterium sp. AusDCA TaxID=3240383 RepID=UPI003DA72A31
MDNMYLSPSEIAEEYVTIGKRKANSPTYKLLILSILAGALIAFAAEGSNVAIHTVASVGLAKALAGILFGTGLMMVIITGAELFTGNTLIVVSCMEKEARWVDMLRNWLLVYVGNFLGAMTIVLFILYSGQLDYSGGLLGGFTIKTAVYKTGLTFTKALLMGIMCNWLVCLAVWMATSAKDIAGKVLAIFFPILLFVTSGFEHSVANMYYIPAGILAKINPAWVDQAQALGVSTASLAHLNWGSFIINNLIPVTLGNIIGGGLFVGVLYWLGYMYKRRPASVRNAEIMMPRKRLRKI